MNELGKEILIVDDEPGVVDILTNRLEMAGYHCTGAGNAKEALKKLSQDSFPLLLLDIRMPGMDGMELLPKVQAGYPDTAVVIVSALSDLSTAVKAMSIGAYDYVVKPFDLDDVLVRVDRALERRRLILDNRDYQQNLEKKVAEQTEEIRHFSLSAIQSLSAALEARDPYTHGHSERVTEVALCLGRRLGLSKEKMEKLRLAGLLHDIGKIGVPDNILHKPGSLTKKEYAQVMNHPVVGETILRFIVRSEEVLRAIRHHHEHYDGNGYPDRLKGNEILLGARILAVADTFEAMTSKRPYRPPLSPEEAMAELRQGAGTQFDPKVVEAFLESEICSSNKNT